MTSRALIVAVSVAVIAAAPAMLPAQNVTPSTDGLVEIDDVDVIGVDGTKIGEVESVLVDASGAIAGVVIETEGFISQANRNIVVDLADLEMVDGQYRVEMTGSELESLPVWDD